MFLRPFFSSRLKILRKSYFLTGRSLSFLLNLKRETSISDYESQRTVPSADVLSDIANLFGVSIDWLSGRSNTPYTDEILLNLEEKKLELLSTALEHDELRYFHISCSWPLITNHRYMNPATRSEFSLPV